VASAVRDRHLAILILQLLCGAAIIAFSSAEFALAQSDPESTGPSAFHFVAVGDMPYRVPADFKRLENLIADVNDDKPAFTVHVGDVKNGFLNCSTNYFLTIRGYFDSFDGPLIYTPGDNDWADCDRALAGGYDTRERLRELRRIFFDVPLSMGGAPIPVRRQSDSANHPDMAENATWSHGGVTFATVHMVGSNNNLVDDRWEFETRNTANIEWIRAAFRIAVEIDSAGIVLMFHADIFSSNAPRQSFKDAKDAIAQGAEMFDRPVLLINGDAHIYGMDNPIRDSRSDGQNRKIKRVIVFGGAKIHAVRVSVDPKSPRLFTVEPLIVKANLAD
jgi:hypothetical protein